MNGSNGANLGVNLAFTKFLFVTPATRRRRRTDAAARGRDPSGAGLLQRLRRRRGTRHAAARDHPVPGQRGRASAAGPRGRALRAAGLVEVPAAPQGNRDRAATAGRGTRRGDGARRRRARAAIHERRDARVRLQAREPARVGTRAAQRHHHSDEKDAGVVGQEPARPPRVLLSARRRASGTRVKGHARAAEAGISTIFRRLYYNPDGHGRADEFDFVTYFECADEHLATFDQICRALRDVRQNPEWRYVIEGPEWRGKRVLKW